MKVIIAFLVVLHYATVAFSQTTKDIVVSIQADLIRSDHDGYFEKLQTGVEGQYFISKSFTATAGLEYWSDEDRFSAAFGARWYPVDYAFLRLRGLVGANDISFGGGWNKLLGENFRFEAMADVYTEGHVAIRAGFSYIIPR